MSQCEIGLVECKYPNTVFKTCSVCVRQQFEDEILAIKKEAYQQGRADKEKELQGIKDLGALYSEIRADERTKTLIEIIDFIKYECCFEDSVAKVLYKAEELKEQSK